MIKSEENARDLGCLVVPCTGRLLSTGDGLEPYRLLDADGGVVEPVAVFLRELLAAGRSAATLRSYGMDLLRWWRFLRAVNIAWDRATRLEARDFSCWIQLTVKQRRLVSGRSNARAANVSVAGAPNPVTGKPALRYWFDVHAFDQDWFIALAERAAVGAGPRYTPELHVDLPIARVLTALGQTTDFEFPFRTCLAKLRTARRYEWSPPIEHEDRLTPLIDATFESLDVLDSTLASLHRPPRNK